MYDLSMAIPRDAACLRMRVEYAYLCILAEHNVVGCIFITYEELNMVHIVGYHTVNTLSTRLHSIEKSIAFYE
jgi:hypothetical protein